MKNILLPVLFLTGMSVMNSRFGFQGRDVLNVSQPNVEKMQPHQEFAKWIEKKNKENALKLLTPEATNLTTSSQTLNAEQQKQFEKAISNLVFIENKGQWHNDVLYLCRMGGLDAWITKYGVNYTFYKMEEVKEFTPYEKSAMPNKFEHKDYNMIGHRVLMKLQNYNPNPTREGKQKQEGYYNYLIGNDPSKHASFVGLYKEAVVKDVYNGIDLRYYFDKGSLRYDYIVRPGADPAQIVFTLEGSDKTYVNEKGNLVFTTRFGEVAMAELKTYQERDKKEIKSEFIKREDKWGIALASYDKDQALIIDPLVYSTYIGGSGYDWGNGIAVGGSGNAYVTGHTQSTNYDVTAGAFQTTNGGGSDVFVTKLNASGSGLVYSTYIGGSSDDFGNGIAVDGSGNAYVTGQTGSTDYDVTTGAFQTTNEGSYDVFVTKLNASGSGLVYSTYIGGSYGDYGSGIAVDGSGNAYVTGRTGSTDYDVTTGAFQTTNGGNDDVFVTKLNASGSGLVYSTYIGGSNDDGGRAIAVDGSGNAYVVGLTLSTNYDVTAGAFQTTHGGGTRDVFVTKLNASGSGLVYSTYIGGSSDDLGLGIAVDGSGNAYVTGQTGSTDYDVTAGAFQTTNGGYNDVFVTKLNASGSGLVYSTYIGGSSDDGGRAIAVDGSGNAYVTGATSSTNYDVTAGAFQTTNGGYYDVFVTKLNASGSGLLYSTYIGGSSGDYGSGIAVDGSGNAYVTGYTQSTDYDVTAGAFQTTYGGGLYDVFVTKLCHLDITLTSAAGTNNQTVCINTAITNITYSSTGATGATFSGLPTGVTGNYSGGNITISGTPTVSGTFNYTVTLTGGCGTTTATGTITVKPNNTITLTSATGTNNQTVCINTAITNITYSSTGATGATFSGLPTGVTGNYSGGNITISGTPTVSGTFNYTVTLTGGCGTTTATGTITVKPNNTITLTSAPATTNQTVCINTAITNITYSSTGATGATFSGLPTGVTGNYSGGNITISGTPTVSGTFNYTVTLTGGCGTTTATGTITVTPNLTITLTSAAGTNNQTVCINTAITNITYSSTGATGATFSGLPTGVTGNYSGGNITISGTPTVSGTFNYTVTLTGGCGSVSTTGTIKVNQNTITLTSAAGTDNQSVCTYTPITNITYTSTGATGATFSGLPAGVTGNFASGNITISGTPTVTGTFNYTITLTGGCGSVSKTGTISIGCVGIEETANNVSWSIFPNPTSGIFTIQSEKGGVFEVLDITGRMLHTCTTKNQTETIRTNLPAGVYFIREKESRATQKLIVE